MAVGKLASPGALSPVSVDHGGCPVSGVVMFCYPYTSSPLRRRRLIDVRVDLEEMEKHGDGRKGQVSFSMEKACFVRMN